jgi:protein-L-isoaspartate(D-aspartate) O-methyltransferase
VVAALRAVPRHRFVPELSLEDAYADRAVAIKTHDEEIVSSISQPGMVAQMLQLLEASPGQRVLEVGTGSGYNAALLSEIVGPSGSVTTIELDEELARRAERTLSDLGYRNVAVIAADATCYRTPPAYYDRLIVSARADDIARAWWDAVADGGRLVVPLRLEGVGEYAIGFVRQDRYLHGVGAHPCAFIAMRGSGAAAAAGDVFYRDPSTRKAVACLRRISDVLAVRTEDATPSLLDDADLVVARSATIFAITFEAIS